MEIPSQDMPNQYMQPTQGHWQGTDPAFRHMSLDAPVDTTYSIPWEQGMEYGYGNEDPIVFTGWMNPGVHDPQSGSLNEHY